MIKLELTVDKRKLAGCPLRHFTFPRSRAAVAARQKPHNWLVASRNWPTLTRLRWGAAAEGVGGGGEESWNVKTALRHRCHLHLHWSRAHWGDTLGDEKFWNLKCVKVHWNADWHKFFRSVEFNLKRRLAAEGFGTGGHMSITVNLESQVNVWDAGPDFKFWASLFCHRRRRRRLSWCRKMKNVASKPGEKKRIKVQEFYICIWGICSGGVWAKIAVAIEIVLKTIWGCSFKRVV